MIERTPVASSNVVSVGFDPEAGTMAVEYKSGDVYHFPASAESYADVLAAKSIGSHLHAEFKGQGIKQEPAEDSADA